MGVGFCEFLVASCLTSPEPSHSKTSGITRGQLDSLEEHVPATQDEGILHGLAVAPSDRTYVREDVAVKNLAAQLRT